MTTYHDVPADLLIEELSQRLEGNDAINAPDWAEFVKTGTHRERIPDQENWWFIRSAAVLRKVALKGPIGANHMAQHFGGPKDRGVKPNRAVAGSRKIARTVLQQLTSAGLIVNSTNIREVNLGKVITPAGQSLLDDVAHSVRGAAEEKYPGLARY
ncbi:MAG: 30S ribosomal protein S19e [Candidatus Thalassarchaeaceae archaeon]|jgi:small subunit ribosomal protein S19e|nr:30S ribosomal protein S19e [Candidatus Thalassarchaeaceae archaeon]